MSRVVLIVKVSPIRVLSLLAGPDVEEWSTWAPFLACITSESVANRVWLEREVLQNLWVRSLFRFVKGLAMMRSIQCIQIWRNLRPLVRRSCFLLRKLMEIKYTLVRVNLLCQEHLQIAGRSVGNDAGHATGSIIGALVARSICHLCTTMKNFTIWGLSRICKGAYRCREPELIFLSWNTSSYKLRSTEYCL